MKDIKDYLIFIIEDDKLYSKMLNFHLQRHEYKNVYVFNEAEDFLNHLHLNPDVVLLDYHLGATNGLEVLKKIKRFNPNIQVILLSAQNEIAIAVDTLKYGAFDYIEKNEQAFDHVYEKIKDIHEMNILLNKRNVNRFKDLFKSFSL